MKEKREQIPLEIGGYVCIEIKEYEEYDIRRDVEDLVDEKLENGDVTI